MGKEWQANRRYVRIVVNSFDATDILRYVVFRLLDGRRRAVGKISNHACPILFICVFFISLILVIFFVLFCPGGSAPAGV